jgi:hypothetical protein
MVAPPVLMFCFGAALFLLRRSARGARFEMSPTPHEGV